MHAPQTPRWSSLCIGADHLSSQRVVQVCRRPSQKPVRRSYISITANVNTHENPSTLSTPASAATCHPGDRWYSGSVTIPRYVEGTKILDLEGKGRGVVAYRDFATGDLVMATPPLLLITSQQRQRPSAELLVDAIIERKLYGSKWFSVLYDGNARSCKAKFSLGAAASPSPAHDVADPDTTDCPRGAQPPEPILASTSDPAAPSKPLKAPATAAAPKKKGFLAAGGRTRARSASPTAGSEAAGASGPLERAEGGTARVPDRREQTRLAKVVKYNCFGDDAEDLAASAVRGELPRGHVGLWPEFALFNHSCAPNTTNYVVGGTMVVRACRPIKTGEEVTISYLGRPQLLPFSRRISMLEEDYGFECSCARCTTEQAHYDKVEDVYMELHEAVEQQLGPAFLEARAAGDLEAVAEVQRETQAWIQRLYGLFRKTMLAPDVRHYVVASMYDAYDLLFSCAAALAKGEDASNLQAMELVSGGSDLHIVLAVRHYDWTVKEHGETSALTGLARAALHRAHVARYGDVSEEMMRRLVDLNRSLHVEG